MTWTKDKPTVEGWYWWRPWPCDKAIMVHILYRRDVLFVIMPQQMGAPAKLSNRGGEWQGPISPEEEAHHV